MKTIQTAAVVGMGALGMLHADLIIRHLGPEGFFCVADHDRAEKYRSMTFSVNGRTQQFPIVDSRDAVPVDLVIVAVKYTALQSALDTMKNCVGPDTTIISVLNGITSEEIIGARYGHEKLIYCIAQGMDAVKFGGDLTYTRPGELRIGIRKTANSGSSADSGKAFNSGEDTLPPDRAGLSSFKEASQARLDALTDYLDRAGIHYTVEPDIMYRLWSKFMLNVGVNQVCMAYETGYGGALQPGETFDTMVGAMREVLALAHAEGIPLDESEISSYIDLIRTLSPEGMPSMRQDGIARRRSEVEMFSGAVRAMAAKHGIAVPVNERLYRKIKEMEAAY